MPLIRTNYKLKSIREKLRRTMTSTEIILWSRLKSRKMMGFKFRRQHSIGPYVLDFYCHALYLAIEIDGGQHFLPDNIQADRIRTHYLNSLQVQVVRFTNAEVFNNFDGVLWKLSEVISRRRRSWPPRPIANAPVTPP